MPYTFIAGGVGASFYLHESLPLTSSFRSRIRSSSPYPAKLMLLKKVSFTPDPQLSGGVCPF